ncbi:alanine racemase [Amycolatopsis acidiphila]|uniref:YhfX family PLP-dependent enzyme n=1 Tax=Amycolatopsis acidiphila TaxID=715473 RepID=A0A558AJ13_9PSEU|nr:alanine racemase [Amycolatopsis acidiphila]TVT24256.1 YhfX family PLP-dependent enzyme [Amycolatopsis acidiphila]UIJ62613.1 alanine racemase [Amycolatopsis acidiphila]GHG85768.1 amino-acid racemase [Amycolatopsis acidiphila]
MFLELLERRNPGLLRAAGDLALRRRIPPNTFVLDVDAIAANGAAIRAEAERLGLSLYFMTKQIGRNPLVTAALTGEGGRETVAVDIADANALTGNGFGLGHIGNLVQVPSIDIPRIVALEPEVISVFSLDKARQIAEEAARQGRVQGLLLRVADPDRDTYLPGMDGGILLAELEPTARAIAALPGVRIDGVTTFPALAYSEAAEPRPTGNFETLLKARDILTGIGIEVRQVNAPGNTSAYTLATQARLGATHVEPGHGFLGTTPFHLKQDLPEIPAACYVTEVAHHVGDRAYVYGGGFFVDDPVWLDPGFRRKVMVGGTAGELAEHREEFFGAGAGETGGFGGIDYYGFISGTPRTVPVGATVVMGFRMQSFVTRANIAVVGGAAGEPRLLGVFDQMGNRLPTYA